jgi:AcrR family transcriptional regulator
MRSSINRNPVARRASATTPAPKKARGRPHLRPEEKALRTRHFLDASCRCFARRGFEATTMEEIAREAGYSPGSIYIYFKDKRELVHAVFEERIAEVMSRIESCLHEKDPAVGVARLVRVVFEHWEVKREQCRVYMTERLRCEWHMKDDFGEKVYKHYLRHLDMVEELCRSGVRKKVFQGSPGALAHYLVGMMNSTIFRWMREEMKTPLTKQTDSLVAFFLKAARPSPERERRSLKTRGSRIMPGSRP